MTLFLLKKDLKNKKIIGSSLSLTYFCNIKNEKNEKT